MVIRRRMCRCRSFLSAIFFLGWGLSGATSLSAYEEPALPTYDVDATEWVDDLYADPPAEDRLNPNTGKTLTMRPNASIKGNQKKATVHVRPQSVKKPEMVPHDDEGVSGEGDLVGDEPVQRVVLFQTTEKGLAGDVLFSSVKETGVFVDLGSGMSQEVQAFLQKKIGSPMTPVELEELALLVRGMSGRQIQCHTYALDRGDLVLEIGAPIPVKAK